MHCCLLEAEQAPETVAAGGTWTGWAVSSLTSKLYRGGSTTGGAAGPTDKNTTDKEKNQGKGVLIAYLL